MSKAAEALLQVPVSSLHPGGSAMDPGLRSPVADDPEAARRGMQYYVGFNCDGCHAANGGGGMGPSLSNSKFIYGSSPGNIFLSIYQGRPNGMPAWGGSLPAEVIWDLAAYVRSISKDDGGSWGTTTSLETFEIEQVPAEFIQTADPWSKTQPFSFGKRPDATK